MLNSNNKYVNEDAKATYEKLVPTKVGTRNLSGSITNFSTLSAKLFPDFLLSLILAMCAAVNAVSVALKKIIRINENIEVAIKVILI
jgi:hypothetical protein